MFRGRALLLLAVFLATGACSRSTGKHSSGEPSSQGVPGVQVYFRLTDDATFFEHPFPMEMMRRADGTIRFDRLVNRTGNRFADHYIRQADEKSNGFSRNAGIFSRALRNQNFRTVFVVARAQRPGRVPDRLLLSAPRL